MIFSIKPARTIQSLVRPRWRNALATTVNLLIDGAEIRHFVMAITRIYANGPAQTAPPKRG